MLITVSFLSKLYRFNLLFFGYSIFKLGVLLGNIFFKSYRRSVIEFSVIRAMRILVSASASILHDDRMSLTTTALHNNAGLSITSSALVVYLSRDTSVWIYRNGCVTHKSTRLSFVNKYLSIQPVEYIELIHQEDGLVL